MSDREIELKFLCAPEEMEAVLAAAPEGEDEVKDLTSVYFDTPDLALQRAGATLRVRSSKGGRVQTFKRGSGFSRQEHEAPIEGERPDPGLGPVGGLLNGRAHELQPAFEVRVTRRQRLVRYEGAEIELALDEGEVRAGDRTSPLAEVELELKSGEPAALFALARELARAAPLHLSFDTKSDRGEALVAGEALDVRRKVKVELERGASAGEAFQALARGALAQMAANAQVLREQPQADAVHQLRVGARTLRSGLSTFRAVVEDDAYPRLKDELRWVAKACDRARNLDVFAQEMVEPAGDMENPPHGLPALARAVEAARQEAWAEAAEAVASERFRQLMIDLAAWTETGDWLQRAGAHEDAAAMGARILDRRRRKLLKRGRRLARLDDEARHEVRIEAKKLRYTSEAFASLFSDKKAHRFIGRVKALQEELGALNDLATAETLVEGLHLEPDSAFAAGELVGLRTAQKPDRIAAAAEAIARLEDADPFWA